ncbi:MAG: gamma-D-glutamyl-L-lysine dipeptidyl-peptidase [Frankiaceae bacterium]|nr:gamma-D-glutamyl-L-lysine dipeptidyl-peptidase [Frankiaceae bacterium]
MSPVRGRDRFKGSRRGLVAVAAALIVAADASAIAILEPAESLAAQQPAATKTVPAASSATELTAQMSATDALEPRLLTPVHYAWVRPAVVNVWEKTTSPRPVDRITMTATPDMRTWVHRLTIALRLDLNGRLMTQALHGDRVAVIQSGRGWSLIRLESQTGGAFPRGIIGYIPSVQLSNSPIARPRAGVHSAATAITVAKRYLGVSYLWAGMSSYGIDCSGLSYMAYRAAGVTLPRDAADQALIGMPVGSRHLLPGDLVFFGRGARTNIHHVGIYLGRGLVLHAPHTGSWVRVSPLSAWSDYWGARRIIR